MLNSFSVFNVRDANPSIAIWRRTERKRFAGIKGLTLGAGISERYLNIFQLMPRFIGYLKLAPTQHIA